MRMVATSAESVLPGALPGCCRRRLRDALRFEPPFGVDRCLAPIGRGRDCLAIAMVVNIAGDENAVDLRARLVAHDEVSLLVDIEPVTERVRVRLVTDRDEQAF